MKAFLGYCPTRKPKRQIEITDEFDFLKVYESLNTVLCKSNASEMREFRSLFSRTFDESSRESSSENSRRFERKFVGTKGDISSNFRYLTENSR